MVLCTKKLENLENAHSSRSLLLSFWIALCTVQFLLSSPPHCCLRRPHKNLFEKPMGRQQGHDDQQKISCVVYHFSVFIKVSQSKNHDFYACLISIVLQWRSRKWSAFRPDCVSVYEDFRFDQVCLMILEEFLFLPTPKKSIINRYCSLTATGGGIIRIEQREKMMMLNNNQVQVLNGNRKKKNHDNHGEWQ